MNCKHRLVVSFCLITIGQVYSFLPSITSRCKIPRRNERLFETYAVDHLDALRGGTTLWTSTDSHTHTNVGATQQDSSSPPPLSWILIGILGSIASWSVIAWKGLMYHPTMELCLRHNIFTIAHALALPIPLILSSFWALTKPPDTVVEQRVQRRLYLGIGVTSLWTGAAVMWNPLFSVGYYLFSNSVRYSCAFAQWAIATWAIRRWAAMVDGNRVSRLVCGSMESFYSLLSPRTDTNETNARRRNGPTLYAASSMGLFLLAILPQLVAFPSATIPTLLGKRLSRSASGFTCLGAIHAHCLQDASESSPQEMASSSILRTLRRGLAVGSIAHFGLAIAKVIGLDGGGLIVPGNGLWENYPSLLKASGAMKFLMVDTFSILSFACLTEAPTAEKLNN